MYDRIAGQYHFKLPDWNDDCFPTCNHIGIANITDRIYRIGGQISIDSQVGVGTTVTVHVQKED